MHAVGSARAPDGINVMEILTAAREHMFKMGGHERVAGFSVAHDKVAVLKSVLEGLSTESEFAQRVSERRADAIVDLEALGWDTVEMLDQFRPYGEGNKRPVLVARQATFVNWRPVGKKLDHAKMSFWVGDDLMDGIGFGLAKDSRLETIRAGDLVDVLFYLECNEYMGRRALQFKVEDIAPAGTVRIEESSK